MEQEADTILEGAEVDDVSFLVVGDPFGWASFLFSSSIGTMAPTGIFELRLESLDRRVVFRATTHTDLVVRAKERGIPVQAIHNASIMNAIGACGLQLYSYGPAVSIVFFTETWRPDSFYDKIKVNRERGFHTLCLLGEGAREAVVPRLLVWGSDKGHCFFDLTDIKVKEQSIENLARYARRSEVFAGQLIPSVDQGCFPRTEDVKSMNHRDTCRSTKLLNNYWRLRTRERKMVGIVGWKRP